MIPIRSPGVSGVAVTCSENLMPYSGLLVSASSEIAMIFHTSDLTIAESGLLGVPSIKASSAHEILGTRHAFHLTHTTLSSAHPRNLYDFGMFLAGHYSFLTLKSLNSG